jgi:NAD+ diphosphatase
MADMPISAYDHVHIFAGNPLDRASDRRADARFLAERLADPNSLAVAMWNGQPLVETGKDGPRLAYVAAPLAREAAGGEERLLFMGLWKDTAVFAIDLEGPADPAEGRLAGLGRFEDLRAMALALPAAEAGLAATAKGVFEWRRRHRFCSVCGQPSELGDAGWKRVCPSCSAEHFPRTDPVVIMLAVNGERCLVGRQARFPKGMWSALAGFMEPGESIEEAAARELMEEAGLVATKVIYHSSQPWPYPSSLMIGLIAEVADGEATPDQTELEAVRWFTRAEARDLVAGKIEGAFAPPPSAIAHHLIKTWSEG